MATEIRMPQLGLTMTEGTIAAWHKKVGESVATGDVLVEIQTDKLTSEIQSELDGVLLAIAAQEGEDVPVQGLLCVIGAAGEKVDVGAPAAAAPAAAPQATPVASAAAPAAQGTPAQGTAQQATPTGRIRISPLAKKVALTNNLDYSTLTGSGPGGRIIHNDVLAALKNPPKPAAQPCATAPCPAPQERRERMSAMRKVVAQRMVQSHTEIPVVTQTMKVDVTKLLEFRATINAQRESRFSVNDLVLKAVAKALAANKQMLVSLDGNEIVHHEHVHLGMAVALNDGLLVPVIKNADALSLETIATAAKDLAARARTGSLSVEEYQGATLSVSNLGMFGVESFTPIINQPNAAILGICSIEDELALVEGQVTNKKILRISMTYDHRLMDGAGAAKFQLAIKALLETPLNIVL